MIVVAQERKKEWNDAIFELPFSAERVSGRAAESGAGGAL